MTYLDYIVQFQRLRRQQPFSSTSADLYYHLLWVANGLGWKNPFNEGSSILMASLGMSDKTLTSARDKLISAGLVRYQAGKKGTFSSYELLAIPQNSTENFRSIRGESGSNQGEKAGAMLGELGGALGGLHKSKIKNKYTKATPVVQGENSSAEGVLKSEPTSEPWAVWLAEHTPTVQRLKSPLTAKQWTKLVADFGEPMVHQVLLAMENKADLLRKYTSANLTARDWCGRRAPAPITQPKPVEPIVPMEPELNPAVTAERQAQRDAEAAENRRQFRAARTAAASS